MPKKHLLNEQIHKREKKNPLPTPSMYMSQIGKIPRNTEKQCADQVSYQATACHQSSVRSQSGKTQNPPTHILLGPFVKTFCLETNNYKNFKIQTVP